MPTKSNSTSKSKNNTKNGGSKTSNSKNASKSKTAAKKSSTKAEPLVEAKRPVRREVGAVVCFFLAFFAFIGFFTSAVFIDFFCGLMRGLIGWGSYAMPVMLLVAAFVLAFHRGRPVRLRVFCAIVSPVFISALVHLFLNGHNALGEEGLIKLLYASGRELQSGGIIGGWLAAACKTLFSTAGACIIFVILLVVLLFAAFNFSVSAMIEAYKNRETLEYEPEQTDDVPAKTVHSVNKHRNIDIPLDDGALPEPVTAIEKPSLFNKRANVKTPAEFLAGETPVQESVAEAEEKTSTGLKPARTAAPEPMPEIVHVPVVEQQMPDEMPDAAPVTPDIQEIKAEADSAEDKGAESVAEEIEESLESVQPGYIFPPLELLRYASGSGTDGGSAEINLNSQRLNETLRSFGVNSTVQNAMRGPSVTRYEIILEPGVKLSKITGLADDIALALGVDGVRIAPVPDMSSMVGIEVPNKNVSTVSLREVIESPQFVNSSSRLSFALGRDISGHCIVGDISKLPHLLIAGTTGSGKSVCMNSLILSLMYKSTPDEVRFIMVDPKMIELGIYNGIPHLLIPVVTDPKKASGALQWAVTEMMKRYRLFSETNTRDIAGYNAACENDPERTKLPRIVIVIDELADLMIAAAKEVEESICRIAQMARAAGMHLVIATQRPSADVITGLMKANIPSRIAFAVASGLESRIILDNTGAEKLVGKGDMLYAPLGSKSVRIQGTFVSDEEREAVVEFVKKQSTAEYSDEVIDAIENAAKNAGGSAAGAAADSDDPEDDRDELFDQAVEVALEAKQVSVSLLQRRLKLGYSRAARIVDQMEEHGVVGPFEGSKPRQVLITKEMWLEKKFFNSAQQPDTSVDIPQSFEPLVLDDE